MRVYSESTKKKHVKAWERSGLRVTEYCRSRGLKVSTFSDWKKKYGSSDSGKEGKFVPVVIEEFKEEKIELLKSSEGVRVRVGLNAPVAKIKELLECLEQVKR